MLQDILNESLCIDIQDKKYKFEFNHLAYASLEKETGKSIYYFYEELVTGKKILYTDLLCLVRAGMLKHHSEQEIDSFSQFLKENIYTMSQIKDTLLIAYIKPLTLPDIVEGVKKKLQAKNKNKKIKN